MSGHYSTPATAHPLDDEDILWEILLRLPPHPSSLPRASAVCKRWRSILSDANFMRCFRKHHRKPPLIGFFGAGTRFKFSPMLDPPDRIPAGRFTPLHSRKGWICTGCRHGLAVLLEESLRRAIVWDPLTGRRHRVTFPPGLEADDDDNSRWHAAVLCADAEDGHVHGDCFSSPFKLVLINNGGEDTFACVYKSVSSVWGDIVSLTSTPRIFFTRPSVLVGNELCWTLCGGGALVFDVERQSLCVIEEPADAHITQQSYGSVQLLRTEDNELGLAILSRFTIQLWERKSECDGVARWVPLQKTIDLEGLFPNSMQSGLKTVLIMGYEEDTNVIVLSTTVGNFLLQVESMQIRHITHTSKTCYDPLHPYTNFYTAGRGVGWKWLDLEL